MRKIVKISQFFIALLFVAGLSAVPAQGSSVVMAAPASIVYNLFATDGFINLVDGTQVYMYGYVGGRAGQPLTYQNSVVAPPGAPKTFVPGANVPLGAVPEPTGGPVTPAELQLAGNAQFPAPAIYAAVGDAVEIRLKNLGVTNKTSPNDPHTIHLHGLDVDAANDGVPETSVAAVPANMPVPGAGNVVVYMFSPKYPGTYMYHCHQEADIHVQMGMYGALVVYSPEDVTNPLSAYNNGGPGRGSGGNLWGYAYDKDVIMLLTEMDLGQHVSEQKALAGAAGFNPVNYKPQYWFVNGLSFPNTIHAAMIPGFNWTNWIAAHPNYDPLITGSVSGKQKVLIRVINLGFETQPMHMHGFHGKIIGSDQRPWTWANTPSTLSGEGLEKNTLTIGSGETYEWLIDFKDVLASADYANGTTLGTYPGGTQSRYDPALLNKPTTNTDLTKPAIPAPGVVPLTNYIAGPTVTDLWGPTVVAGTQIFVFHNHDDYKATNNGVYPGGMFTAIIPLLP